MSTFEPLWFQVETFNPMQVKDALSLARNPLSLLQFAADTEGPGSAELAFSTISKL